jgi:hypothetical protein
MGTMSPKQERDMLFGCLAILVFAVVLIGSVGFALYSLVMAVVD